MPDPRPVNTKRWHRDPVIGEMIAYFDRPEKCAIELLTKKEKSYITQEILKCQQSFEYAARNYFWITDEENRDVLFNLWEGQELILDRLYYLKRRNPGMAQKMMILKARRLGALAPETKVLVPHNRWVPINDLAIGDAVVSVEEHCCGNEDKRRVSQAIVLDKWETERLCYEITLDSGVVLNATDDHLFLVRIDEQRADWLEAMNIHPGDELRTLVISESYVCEQTYGWAKVVSSKLIGERKAVDIQTSDHTFIAEGVVTHNCSTLVEALIAWSTMFFPNRNALIVSYDQEHSEHLYSIMQHIYDYMPWWLKPKITLRSYSDGIWFENPDESDRRAHPGLNSRIMVQPVTRLTGVGRGVKLSACHLCLTPDTLVHTANGRLKPISEITCYDQVITSKGVLASVKGVYKSERANELTAQIWVAGSDIPLCTTLDHEILTAEGFRPAADLRLGSTVRMPVRKILNTASSGVIVSIDGNNKMQVASPINSQSGREYGRYISNGTNNVAYTYLGMDVSAEAMQHGRLLPASSIPDSVWEFGVDFCLGLVMGLLDYSRKLGSSEVMFCFSKDSNIPVQARSLIASLGFGWANLVSYKNNGTTLWALKIPADVSFSIMAAFNLGDWNASAGPKYGMGWGYTADRGFLNLAVDRVSVGFSQDFYDLEVDAEEHDFCTLQCCVKNSEYASWDPRKAEETIESAMGYAISRNPDSFAILESTGKGAGTYAHRLWKANVALGEKADWYPLFLPWFFERTRRRVVDMGWRPQREELAMRERVAKEWVRCDNPECGEYRETVLHGQNLEGSTCTICSNGTFKPVILDDEQLAFMEHERINKEQKGQDAVKALKEELCTTAESAWQISGIQVFPQACLDWVNETVIKYPPVVGNLDEHGNIHWMKEWKTVSGRRVSVCGHQGCTLDHQYDEEHALRIWEWPKPGAAYVVGADVSEGIGRDYSVAWINRIGNGLNPDVHVATYRTNTVSAADFAAVLNFLGRFYNDALMSIEYNYPTTADLVLRFYNYPNCFRWKHYDSTNPLSNKFHWVTQYNTKPRLWQMAVRRLRAKLWVVRDPIFYEEMQTFQKDEADSRAASAERGFNDDVLIAACIALFTSHDLDWDETGGHYNSTIDGTHSGMVQSKPWMMACTKCEHKWESGSPEGQTCPNCGSIMVRGKMRDSAPKAQAPSDSPVKAYVGIPGPSISDEESIDNDSIPEYSRL